MSGNALQDAMFEFAQQSWVIQVFVVVFATLCLDFVQSRFLRKLREKLAATANYWDDALVDALGAPLRVIIWLVGIAYAMSVAQIAKTAIIFQAVGPLRDIGVIAVLAWFLVRFVDRVKRSYIDVRQRDGKRVDTQTAEAIARLVRASVIITSVLVVLQTLGYSISGVLAFGGVGGIAVGFAAKDLLANFFGGLMIYLDRPFSVGDWVRSPDREIEGTVEQIGWRQTIIRTFDKRPLYIPNGLFTQIVVENPSRMTNRRIYETIGIRYADAARMETVVADVRSMLQTHPDIDANQTLIVNFNAFAPSSLDFFIYTFTKTTDWVRYHAIKQDVMLKVIEIIEQTGAECAFPTSTVYLEANSRHEPADLPAREAE